MASLSGHSLTSQPQERSLAQPSARGLQGQVSYPVPYPTSEGPAVTSSLGSSETAFPTDTSPLSQPANARQEKHTAVALNVPESVCVIPGES